MIFHPQVSFRFLTVLLLHLAVIKISNFQRYDFFKKISEIYCQTVYCTEVRILRFGVVLKIRELSRNIVD